MSKRSMPYARARRAWRALRSGGRESTSEAVDANDLLFDDALVRRLERLALRTYRVTGSAGSRPGQLRAPAADFIDHRPYSPGDDQRHIDWPAAARHDALFVKVGQAPQAADVHLLLDASPSMTRQGGKWHQPRRLAAALGWMSLAHGDRVSVHSCPADANPPWGPARGGGKGPELLAHLASLGQSGVRQTVLAPAVRAVTRSAPAGGMLVVLSDLWVVDDLYAALGLAPTPRWQVLVLHVLSRAELSPALEGSIRLVDAESGDAITMVADADMMDQYRLALNAHLERVRIAVARRGASYALVPADWPLERAVIPYLQRRMVLSS